MAEPIQPEGGNGISENPDAGKNGGGPAIGPRLTHWGFEAGKPSSVNPADIGRAEQPAAGAENARAERKPGRPRKAASPTAPIYPQEESALDVSGIEKILL